MVRIAPERLDGSRIHNNRHGGHRGWEGAEAGLGRAAFGSTAADGKDREDKRTGLAKAPADSPLTVEVGVRERSHVTDNVAQSDTLLAG